MGGCPGLDTPFLSALTRSVDSPIGLWVPDPSFWGEGLSTAPAASSHVRAHTHIPGSLGHQHGALVEGKEKANDPSGACSARSLPKGSKPHPRHWRDLIPVWKAEEGTPRRARAHSLPSGPGAL